VLPAFSTFVDGKIAVITPHDNVFAIADYQVISIPGSTVAPRRSPVIH
jgi:hypothetical protein